MTAMSKRRTNSPISVVMCGGAAYVLVCMSGKSFTGSPRAADNPKARTSMQGFKEDFQAWRSSLTPEEQALIQAQAQGEFNKAYRKTDEFEQDLPAEKIDKFGGILKKFFDNENEDYKKNTVQRVPDYDGLLKKAGDKKMDFSLRNRIIEIDRNADRRYDYAARRIRLAEDAGEKFPQSSPRMAEWIIENNDTETHEANKWIIEMFKKAKEMPNCPDDCKPLLEEWIEKGVPNMGEDIHIFIPETMADQTQIMTHMFDLITETVKNNQSEEFYKEWSENQLPEAVSGVIKLLSDRYVAARDEVEGAAQTIKKFYRSQENFKGKDLTKADVVKSIWEALEDHYGTKGAPIDEEFLAEMAQEPAIQEGEFMHSWGTADKLYKSEAIDAFGMKYLLGVYETVEESQKAFDDWNAKYIDARKSMADDMAQWSKQQQARLDEESNQLGVQRIRKMIQEARTAAASAR